MLTFLLILAFLAVLCRPVGFDGFGALSDGKSPPALAWPATNFGATDIAGGTVLARYGGETSSGTSDAILRAVKNTIGVVPPSLSNVDLIGICRPRNTSLLKAGSDGALIAGGLVQCKVRIPAAAEITGAVAGTTQIPIGTDLVPCTVWDATNHNPVFGTTTAGANAGAMEPVIHNGVTLPAANPMGHLREPLTIQTNATITTAWVYIHPYHKPRLEWLPFQFMGANTTAKSNVFMALALGPGEMVQGFVQLLNQGSGGDTTVNFTNNPLGGTADSQNLWSTAGKLNNDGTDGAITNAGADGTGDTDNGGLGTGGTVGTLNTLAKRQFVSRSLFGFTVAYNNTPSGMVDLTGRLLVKYY